MSLVLYCTYRPRRWEDMALVDYSESEGSDDETQAPQGQQKSIPDPHTSTSSKPSFQKKIEKSNPRKIKADLPSTVPEGTPASKEGEDAPPAKRARTGGGGFNSFLPAPKNPTEAAPSGNASGRLLSRGGGGVGRGVSLKTGAQPAFSRAPEPPREAADEQPGDFAHDAPPVPETQLEEQDPRDSLPDVPSEAKVAPRKPMFKPLSVGRKLDKKKKKPPLVNGSETTMKAAQDGPPSGASGAEPPRGQAAAVTAPPPKRSLFASAQEEPQEEPDETSHGTYQPYLEEPAPPAPQPNGTTQEFQPAPPTNQPAQNLDTLASSLNLTPAQRRQLFGRTGVPTAAQLQQFSVSQEYASNAAAAAEGEANAAAAPKTVKSIAPGKHSLQQLLNQASTQKDALEESFARGKSNKKEGASRYGWG